MDEPSLLATCHYLRIRHLSLYSSLGRNPETSHVESGSESKSKNFTFTVDVVT